MEKPDLYEIYYKDCRLVYQPGDVVSGVVTATLNHPRDIKRIMIRCKGFANVFWTEQHGDSNHPKTVVYASDQKYFQFDQPFCGGGDKVAMNNKITMAAGHHNFPFSFQLPFGLASSFDGGTGKVEYCVEIIIGKHKKLDKNNSYVFNFLVIDHIDLNHIPELRNPFGCSASKHLCCWMCKSRPIDVEVSTNKSGYAPGEYVVLNIHIENHSKSKIKGCRARVVQSVSFITPAKSKFSRKVISSINGTGCAIESAVDWPNALLEIPPTAPTGLRNCSIIKIHYFLEVELLLRTISTNLTASGEIVIGSIPLCTDGAVIECQQGDLGIAVAPY